MKRYTVLILFALALFSIQNVFAQDTQKITLNDATPGIDVVVSTPPGTTGAVSLQLSGASVTVKDNSGGIVFQIADSRLHGLELHFAPDSAPHTITVERLPGIAEAYVATASQIDLTQPAGIQLISSGIVNLGQELDTSLSAANPGATLSLTIPNDIPIGKIVASFPGIPATAQIIDGTGASIASLQPSHIDGLSMSLDSGSYGLTLLNNDPAMTTLASVSVTADTSLPLPSAVLMNATTSATQSPVVVQTAPDCTVQIAASSVNLRSGPGTGYSILNYGFRNDQLTVGGTNLEGTWLLVASSQGSAWMDKTLGDLTGDCNNLQTYNIPYREASAPQIVIQPPTNNGIGSPVFGGEHEGHEHGEQGEHEGDD